jgi:putative membrane protein
MHIHPLHAAVFAALLSGSLAAHASSANGPPNEPPTERAAAQAGQVQAYQAQRQTAQAGELNRKDRKFIDKALGANAAEIELGRLAERQAGSDEVREFGRTMQQHHRQAAEQLAALSPQHSVEAAEPERKQRKKIDQLAEITDPQAFDAAYTELMVEMHQQDIELFEDVADNDAYSPQVRQYAQDTLSGLRQHLQLAQRLDQRVGRVAGLDDD